MITQIDWRASDAFQKAFDAMLGHLRQQGKRSIHPQELDGPVCAYRGEGGAMCAVGCLMPDDQYNPDLEGRSASNDYILEAVGVSVPAIHIGIFLRIVQRQMHDELSPGLLSFADQLELAAQDVARTYNLTYTSQTPIA